jgi:hypothetical protein
MTSPVGKRPSRYDEAVIAAAVEALWPDLVESLGDDLPTDETEIEESKASLRRAFRFEEDAYKVARDLDRDGWDPDQELVDALEAGTWKLIEATRAAVKAWVAAGGVKADLPAGTRVKHPSLKGHVGEIVDGEIVDGQIGDRFDPRLEGQYHVFCKELGHVRDADAERAKGNRSAMLVLGIYLNAEDVEVVESSAGETSR